MSADDRVLCPSSPCEAGAILVGIITRDGHVAFAPDRLDVGEEFVRVAREGRQPERRFRFASPCVRGACCQWTGTRCGVVDQVIADLPTEPTDSLPACSIRPRCRWFAQTGAAACAVCPVVITDLREESGHSHRG